MNGLNGFNRTELSDIYPPGGRIFKVKALYDELVTKYPNYVTKNALTVDNTTNYEYVFTSGNYNAKEGRRSQDVQIAKPVILITSGIHGDEKSSVMALYYLAKSLCENHGKLSNIIDYVTIKTIPVVNMWGFTNDSRLNENGVNLNRNFASEDWVLTSQGSNYSGAAPGDQPETQIVQNWILSNTNAVALIDFHNSAYENEISCLLGSNESDSVAFKKKYLLAINKIIPYWRTNRFLLDDSIYSYTGNTTTGGTTKSYGKDQGILSYTLETPNNIIKSGRYSNFTIGTGCEVIAALMNGLQTYFENI